MYAMMRCVCARIADLRCSEGRRRAQGLETSGSWGRSVGWNRPCVLDTVLSFCHVGSDPTRPDSDAARPRVMLVCDTRSDP